MNRYRRVRYFYVFLITTSVFAWGCTGKATELEQIIKSGEIKIGTEGTLPPFNYQDESGKLQGFEVDLGREIANRLGVKATFVTSQWDALLLGLNSGEFDIVIDDVFDTKEREERFAFSAPYLVSKSVIITKSDAAPIKSADALKGKIAVQSVGTVQAKLAAQYAEKVIFSPDIGSMSQIISQGMADCMIVSNIEFAGVMKRHPELQLRSDATIGDNQFSAIVMRKQSADLKHSIDSIILSLKQDGYLSRQAVKYFGTDVSQ